LNRLISVRKRGVGGWGTIGRRGENRTPPPGTNLETRKRESSHHYPVLSEDGNGEGCRLPWVRLRRDLGESKIKKKKVPDSSRPTDPTTRWVEREERRWPPKRHFLTRRKKKKEPQQNPPPGLRCKTSRKKSRSARNAK